MFSQPGNRTPLFGPSSKGVNLFSRVTRVRKFVRTLQADGVVYASKVNRTDIEWNRVRLFTLCFFFFFLGL